MERIIFTYENPVGTKLMNKTILADEDGLSLDIVVKTFKQFLKHNYSPNLVDRIKYVDEEYKDIEDLSEYADWGDKYDV